MIAAFGHPEFSPTAPARPASRLKIRTSLFFFSSQASRDFACRQSRPHRTASKCTNVPSEQPSKQPRDFFFTQMEREEGIHSIHSDPRAPDRSNRAVRTVRAAAPHLLGVLRPSRNHLERCFLFLFCILSRHFLIYFLGYPILHEALRLFLGFLYFSLNCIRCPSSLCPHFTRAHALEESRSNACPNHFCSSETRPRPFRTTDNFRAPP